MVCAILTLMLLPFINFTLTRSSKFRIFFSQAYWFLVGDFLILGWLGQKPVEDPYISLGLYSTIFYFSFILIIIPLIGIIEKYSINTKVINRINYIAAKEEIQKKMWKLREDSIKKHNF